MYQSHPRISGGYKQYVPSVRNTQFLTNLWQNKQFVRINVEFHGFIGIGIKIKNIFNNSMVTKMIIMDINQNNCMSQRNTQITRKSY